MYNMVQPQWAWAHVENNLNAFKLFRNMQQLAEALAEYIARLRLPQAATAHRK
jgi:hypothetical protein